MRIHQLFLPLMSEANEHVLARALQPLAMVSDESQETINVDIIFEVDGQYVPHSRPWPDSPSRQKAQQRFED
jgi:hypothetical protein